MKVIVTGSNGLIGQQIVKDLKNTGKYEVLEFDLIYGHDLTDEMQVKEIFKDNRASGLVNCFALNDHVSHGREKDSFLDMELDDFEKSFRVNVIALFSVNRQFIKNNQSGKIINFSSIYGYRSPRPSYYDNGNKDPSYGASKAAVTNLTKYLAIHAPKFNINCVVPGGVANDQGDNFVREYIKDLPAARLMNRYEITGLVEFLLSDSSNYCTGSEFFIDGGWNAR